MDVPISLLMLLACQPAAPTWSADVRPIVASSCVGCHFDGGPAPFALQTWEQASAAAPALAASAEAGRMPPWGAEAGCGEFQDDPTLPAEAIATLRAWSDAGAPEGEPTAPLAPAPTSLGGAEVASISAGYAPAFASGSDDYRCFFVDRTFEVETFITAVQIEPGTEAVHHVLLFSLTPAQAAAALDLDAADAAPGYPCFGSPTSSGGEVSLRDSEGGVAEIVATWAPGAQPNRAGEGLAWPVARGGRLVAQVHYARVGEAAPDDTRVALVTTAEAPPMLIRSRPLLDLALEIEAGDPAATASRTVTNWTGHDVTWRAALPHMHLLGDSIEARRGDGGCLVRVPDWDFHWQRNYTWAEDARPVLAPGEQVAFTCTWDNSAANQPVIAGARAEPRDVAWGEDTDEEMCLVFVESIEPYAPLPAPEDAPCASASACVAACASPSWDCLIACPDVDLACLTCALDASEACALGDCPLQALAVQPCVTECVGDVVAFGGSPGACVAETCGERWDGLLACTDPILRSGACDAPLAACGVAWPSVTAR